MTETKKLERDLRDVIEGEVRFSDGDRGLYANTGSNYRQLPIGVVIPRSVDDVVAAVAVARDHGAPILPRGGGTSLAGQCLNVAVVLDFSKYLNRVLEIDPDRRLARVEPGCVLDRLREEAQDTYGLTFGPDPSTHNHCTLGGMIGNNSCGVHSVMSQFYGPGPRTSDNVAELEILTYRGERLTVGAEGAGVPPELAERLRDLADRYGDLVRERYPKIPRRVSGYNLDDLLPENGFHVARALAGTEGTCVTLLSATVHLIDSPPCRTLVVAGYEDAATAADHVPDVLEHQPLGLEGVDAQLIEDMTMLGMHQHDLSLLPEGGGWLVIETGGETKEEADENGRKIIAALEKAGDVRGTKLYDDPPAEEHIWKVREAGLGATAFLPGKPDTHEGWEDSAVPPERLGEYLRRLQELTGRYGYESALYGHYGQGCVHARFNFDLESADGIATWRRFMDDAADLVLSLGGSLSGEHGDGQSRAELLPKMFGDELVRGFREFKAIWDPDGRMNPKKVVDPYPITSNLRFGTNYRPKVVKPHFAYPADGGSFAHATVRCVGIGECRRMKGGVMCPSYMVTREEKHSTRGRAHLLWEMLNNEDIELWKSEEVLDALDLCLSCKGCTNDCPVNVDMPTLKAEFLAHHYRRKLRPRHAYAFGLIDVWAQVASLAPSLANLTTQSPGISALVKAAGGVSQSRQLPRFAPTTFRSWFDRKAGGPGGGTRVILWPDTFTNHFEPQVGAAAVRVLRGAGFGVTIPRKRLCCGRPLYYYGFLGLARRYLERILHALRDDIRRGTPIVGLEPSCVAVFKDELTNLLPRDKDAERLSKQVFHLAEFLCERADGYSPPGLDGHVLLHGHCHGRATGAFEHERKLLEQTGATVDAPDTGCCGMAGAWGYESAHYEVSRACAERVLLPAVRDAAARTPIVASGFSCRSQISQLEPGRSAVHVAQVLDAAGRESRPAFRGTARREEGRHYPTRGSGRHVARRSR